MFEKSLGSRSQWLVSPYNFQNKFLVGGTSRRLPVLRGKYLQNHIILLKLNQQPIVLTLRITQNIALNSNDLFVHIFGLFFPSFCSNSWCICFNVFHCILIALCCNDVWVFFRIIDAGFPKNGQSKSRNLPGLRSCMCRLKKLSACRQQSWKPLVLGYTTRRQENYILVLLNCSLLSLGINKWRTFSAILNFHHVTLSHVEQKVIFRQWSSTVESTL